MSRGKKRRRAPLSAAPPDSRAALRAAIPGRLHEDRVTMVPRSERRADGMPPRDVVQSFINRAKNEGCICPDPQVIVHKSAFGGGAVALAHEDYCPLIRVLDEQAGD